MVINPFYSGRGFYDITADDGSKYVFVPKEFAEKGFVQDGYQWFEPDFLSPDAFSKAKEFTLPTDSSLTEAAKSLYSNPTQGYIWKAEDFSPLNKDDFSVQGYQISPYFPKIQGISTVGGKSVYVTDASQGHKSTYLSGFDPATGSAEFTNINASQRGGGGFFGGLLGDLGPLVPLGLALFAPGIGSAVGAALGLTGTAAAVVGSAIVNGAISEAQGGSFKDGAIKGAISAGVAPTVAQTVGSSVATAMGDSALKNVVANAVSSAATGAVSAALTGGDVEEAAKTGALAGAGGSAGRELGTAAELGTTPFSQQTQQLAAQTQGLGTPSDFGASLGAGLAAGVDPTKALVNALATAQGQKSAATGKEVTEAPVTVPGADKLAEMVSQPGVQLAQLAGGIAFPSAEDAQRLREQGIELPQVAVDVLPEVSVRPTPEELASAREIVIEPTELGFVQEPFSFFDPSYRPKTQKERQQAQISGGLGGSTTGFVSPEISVDTIGTSADKGTSPPPQEFGIPDKNGQELSAGGTGTGGEGEETGNESETSLTAQRPTILERPYISGGRRSFGPTVTTLGQALSPAFFPSAPVSGLTSYRGAGEIESPGTGKARRNVWNEASLKLKDALGL